LQKKERPNPPERAASRCLENPVQMGDCRAAFLQGSFDHRLAGTENADICCNVRNERIYGHRNARLNACTVSGRHA